MTLDDYKKISKAAIYNREAILKAKHIGCYYCLKISTPQEITKWCDPQRNPEGPCRTALCPNCGIDSVIPLDMENKEVEMKKLKEAHDIGFGKNK